jgi:hypothetical protein
MAIVYLVRHYDQETAEDDDKEKIIGVYSTEALAKQAIERLKDKPGFLDFPSWWWIDHITLNKDSWTDGFVTALPGGIYLEDEL